MSILDARELDANAELSTDVCIVGAGAAGLTVAAALEGGSRDVCIIESGGFQPDEETQSLYDLEAQGYPIREHFMSRARYYGGSCNLWAGRSMRFDACDLAHRSWVQYSGWPLAHTELARYYPEAARIMGLPDIGFFEAERHEAALSAEERSLYAGDALVPTVSLWATRPKRFGAAHRARLRRSRTVRLMLHGNVTKITLDADGGRVESVEGATLAGNRFRVRARAVVLACGGLENARLLLFSRDQHERGVGNACGQVGRYLMDHPRGVYGTVRLREGARLSLLDARPRVDGTVQFGVGFSDGVQQREGLLDHYATLEVQHSEYTARQYQSFIQIMKVLLRRGYAGSRWRAGRANMGHIAGMLYLLAPRELIPHWVYRSYWHARRAVGGAPASRDRVVVYFCEQPPDPESRVTLSRSTDRLGMNRLILNWKVDPCVHASVYRLQALLKERLDQTGMGTLREGTGEIAFTDASHHMGTTRMSETPRTGVVDTDGQVHGVHGLYLAGSSVFPSASHKNPTLTIVALALRLAQHLERNGG